MIGTVDGVVRAYAVKRQGPEFRWDWKLINDYIFVSDFAENDGELYKLVRFNPNKQDNVLEFLVSGIS